MLVLHPDASTWEERTWAGFIRAWIHECTEYHEHEPGDTAPKLFIPLTPQSTPPSSPSSLSASTDSNYAPTPPPLRSPSPKKSAKATREELAYLASFRPGPGPLSPQRAAQQFARVLGPEALRPFPTPSVTRGTQRGAGSATVSAAHKPKAAREGGGGIPHSKSMDGAVPGIAEPAGGKGVVEESREVRARKTTPVMYAVSGSNRVFQDR